MFLKLISLSDFPAQDIVNQKSIVSLNIYKVYLNNLVVFKIVNWLKVIICLQFIGKFFKAIKWKYFYGKNCRGKQKGEHKGKSIAFVQIQSLAVN